MSHPYWAPRQPNSNIAPAWVASAMQMETGVAISTTPTGKTIETVDDFNAFTAARQEAAASTVGSAAMAATAEMPSTPEIA
ncbi:MAG TPA: hypothetical protein VJR27_03765 [Candidatus Saccharimonadales bacterium]|nr:hypothetical protein [Candidatus Saccharimonadales bacterium]